MGIEHYENFYTEATGLNNPRAYQAASPQAESDEVYELIDDIIPLSLNESTNNASSKSPDDYAEEVGKLYIKS